MHSAAKIRAAKAPVAKTPVAKAGAAAPVRLQGQEYRPARLDARLPPTLFVTVDTEEEFDWAAPFDRRQVSVSAMAAQGRAQTILERYGLRPLYLIDYPVASQPEGYRPLLEIMARGGCEIGAHLHPWTNPPFEEEVCDRNSYPGNLAPELEERKLAVLVAAIEANLGVRPRFYKSGRYGIGPATLEALVRHDLAVDFSILPGSDLRPLHGPDFRHMRPLPYHAGRHGLLTLPMTSGRIGPLWHCGAGLERLLDAPAARALRLRGILAKLHLYRKVTLTPEGYTAAEQIALLRALHRRGQRVFVLHYHSPSLAPGHTPYVRNEADLAEFLRRLDAVCRFFCETLGGRAGDPRDLLPPDLGAPDLGAPDLGAPDLGAPDLSADPAPAEAACTARRPAAVSEAG